MNQQLLSQLNLGEIATNSEGGKVQTEDISSPQTSLVTVFVSGKNPGEFSKVISTITLGDDENESTKRYKRSDEDLLKLMLTPSKVQPVARTAEPSKGFEPFAQDHFSAYDIL